MAKDGNLLVVTGRIGKPPELKMLPSNTTICNFSVAVTTTEKNKSTGKYEDATEWFNCVSFNQQAEFIKNYIGKGARVYVQGRLRTEKYTNSQGQEQKSQKFIVSEIVKLSEGKEGAPSQGKAPADGEIPGFTEADFGLEDIPF